MQQDRVTLKALIDSYITTNGNKDITGAQLNEVLTNLNDSAFLQLDEIRTALSTAYSPATPSDWNVLPTEVKAALDEAISRVEGLENAGFQTAIQTPYTATTPTDWDVVPTELQSSTDELASRMRTLENEPNQTAFETPYSPANASEWNPEGAPSEVKGGLDILAARTGANESTTIAYVSNTGVNPGVTPEVGNPLKPFTTFAAAIAALPSNNWKIISMGGTYTENIAIGAASDFELDLSGTRINGSITGGAERGLINLQGGWVFYTGSGYAVNIGASNTTYPVKLNGGLVFANGASSNGVFLNDACSAEGVQILAPNGTGIGTGPNEGKNNTFVNHCRVESNIGINGLTLKITNTKVIATDTAFFATGNSIANNSTFISTGAGITAVRGNPVVGCYLTSCYIESQQGRAFDIMQDGTGALNCFVQNSILNGDTDCVQLGTASSPIAAGIDFVFKDCTLYAGTGVIFSGAIGVQAGSLRSINNTYNQNYTPINNVVEYNKTEIPNLQIPVVES